MTAQDNCAKVTGMLKSHPSLCAKQEGKQMKMRPLAVRFFRLVTFVLLMSLTQFEAAQAQAPQGKPVTVRGKISAIENQTLKVTTSTGEVLLKLPDNLRVGGLEAAKLTNITAGNYV